MTAGELFHGSEIVTPCCESSGEGELEIGEVGRNIFNKYCPLLESPYKLQPKTNFNIFQRKDYSQRPCRPTSPRGRGQDSYKQSERKSSGADNGTAGLLKQGGRKSLLQLHRPQKDIDRVAPCRPAH